MTDRQRGGMQGGGSREGFPGCVPEPEPVPAEGAAAPGAAGDFSRAALARPREEHPS